MTNNSLKAQSEPGNTNASLGDLAGLMDDSAPKPASISEGTIPFDVKSKPIKGQMLLIGAGVLNPESEKPASTQTNLSVEDELSTKQSALANPTPIYSGTLKDEPSGTLGETEPENLSGTQPKDTSSEHKDNSSNEPENNQDINSRQLPIPSTKYTGSHFDIAKEEKADSIIDVM